LSNITSRAVSQSVYTCRYRPCHPLAQYIINQINTLQMRPQDIIRAMGYAVKHSIPACERLRHVLSNQYLGLDGSYMDASFTADEFLAKLFSVLKISYEAFAEDIDQIKHELAYQSKPSHDLCLKADDSYDFGHSNWMRHSDNACS